MHEGITEYQIRLQRDDPLDARLRRAAYVLHAGGLRHGEQFLVLHVEQRRADHRKTQFQSHGEIVGRIESDDPAGRLRHTDRRSVDCFAFQSAAGALRARRRSTYQGCKEDQEQKGRTQQHQRDFIFIFVRRLDYRWRRQPSVPGRTAP